MKRIWKVMLVVLALMVGAGAGMSCCVGCQAQSTVTPATETVTHKDCLVQPKQTKSQDFTVEIWSDGQKHPAPGSVLPN